MFQCINWHCRFQNDFPFILCRRQARYAKAASAIENREWNRSQDLDQCLTCSYILRCKQTWLAIPKRKMRWVHSLCEMDPSKLAVRRNRMSAWHCRVICTSFRQFWTPYRRTTDQGSSSGRFWHSGLELGSRTLSHITLVPSEEQVSLSNDGLEKG